MALDLVTLRSSMNELSKEFKKYSRSHHNNTEEYINAALYKATAESCIQALYNSELNPRTSPDFKAVLQNTANDAFQQFVAAFSQFKARWVGDVDDIGGPIGE